MDTINQLMDRPINILHSLETIITMSTIFQLQPIQEHYSRTTKTCTQIAILDITKNQVQLFHLIFNLQKDMSTRSNTQG
jgi:hypothetical protein